jgi:enediyne biosynthesis protein E4
VTANRAWHHLAVFAASLFALLVLTFPGSDADGFDPMPVFTDVAASSGLDFRHVNGNPHVKDFIFETKGGGVAFLDYDNDGFLDIIFAQGSTLEKFRKGDNPPAALYRNKGDGTFEEVTEKAGIRFTGWGMGVCTGDYDNDGFVDILLTYFGDNVLYRNNGDGTFTDVTAKAGVNDPRWSTSAAFGDYDQDGFLDLYVANYLTMDINRLPEPRCNHRGNPVMCGPRGIPGASGVLFRNNGDGTFTDVTEKSGAVDKDSLFSLGVIWADVDNDGDLDLFVGNDATPNLFFVNNGDGTFEEYGFLSGLAVSADGQEQADMGVDAADYDNDGLLDFYMTHFSMEYNSLFRNQGDLMFEDITAQSGIENPQLTVSWGTRFVDLNLDGWKDIFHANGHVYPYLVTTKLNETWGQPKTLYLNQQNGTFRNVTAASGADLMKETVSRGVAFGDYDNDGDIDMVCATLNGPPQLLRNDRRDSNHWVMFRTVGRKSNRDGIGARITVTTGTLTQIWEIKRTVGIYSSSDPRAHFGLGKASRIDSVKILWPSGKQQEFKDVVADAHYVIDEDEGLRKGVK